MSGPLRLLLVLLVLAAAPLARAQAPAPDDGPDDGLVINVAWGFTGVVVGERWTPVRLNLSSGTRAQSGVIEITYRQDGAQYAKISLPFATTPGRVVPLEAVLALPNNCERIDIRALDDRGRRLLSRTISTDEDDPASQMPLIVGAEGATLLSVGNTSLVESLTKLRAGVVSPDKIKDAGEDDAGAQTRTQTTRQPPTPPLPPGTRIALARPTSADDSDPWSLLAVWGVDAKTLPSSWMAYDALAAVVIHAGEIARLRPDALASLRRWLEAGGSVVVLADAPDADAWRMLLAPGAGDTLLRLAPPTRIPPPSVLRVLVAEAADQAPARPITLSPRAQRLGWTTRWDLEDGSALLAEGPAGFGWLTILGVHPQRVGALASHDNTARVWHDALAPIVEDWTESAPERDWYYRWDTSGALPRHQGAIASILDHTLRVPTPGVGVFVVLVLFVVALAALVGPVDAVVLKRLRRRQLSWATALAYTAGASLLAAAIPLAMRSGQGVYSRASGVDVLAPQIGAAAQRTALSSVFSSGSGRLDVVGADPASWWRAVSPVSAYSEILGGPTFNTAQSARATPTGLARGNTPVEGNARVWTLRTTLDQGPTTPPLVTIEPINDGRSWRVRIIGIGAINRVVNAHVMLPMQGGARTWVVADSVVEPDGGLSLVFPADTTIAAHRPEPWSSSGVEDEDASMLWQYTRDTSYEPSRFFDLPGAWRRTRAIDAYVGPGACALVTLELWRDEPDVTISRASQTSVLEVYRVVVPLPERAPSNTPEEPAP